MHRLPPNHDCIFLLEFLERPSKDREFIDRIQGKTGSPQERIAALIKNSLILRFSLVELVHLVTGTALVAAVGLSMNSYQLRWDFLAVFISAFIIHEFGHKFLAQAYHALAEFRLIPFGAGITAISALPILPFKFIAPGAVFVQGQLSKGRLGRVSWIGPLTNLAMGSGFIIAYFLNSWLHLDIAISTLTAGAMFNGWIAIFNLIPFMGLDGSKIFAWNKLAWVLTIGAAAGLFFGSDLISGGGTVGFLGRWF